MIIAGIETNSNGEEYVGAFITFGGEDWVEDAIKFCEHLKRLDDASPEFLAHMDNCIAYIHKRAVTLRRKQ